MFPQHAITADMAAAIVDQYPDRDTREVALALFDTFEYLETEGGLLPWQQPEIELPAGILISPDAV